MTQREAMRNFKFKLSRRVPDQIRLLRFIREGAKNQRLMGEVQAALHALEWISDTTMYEPSQVLRMRYPEVGELDMRWRAAHGDEGAATVLKVHDETERKRLERKIKKADRMSVK